MPSANTVTQETPFAAARPWSPARPESLVICCSDGRWHAQVEEFVQQRVSARADMYAVPGGTAALWAASSSVYTRTVALDALDFLVVHHRLESLWLIAHQDCAWYRARHEGLDVEALRRRQWADLDAVAAAICERYAGLTVHRVYAALEGDRVTFADADAAAVAEYPAPALRPR
jgi:hypothetical protein